jgi:hypothetical protein
MALDRGCAVTALDPARPSPSQPDLAVLSGTEHDPVPESNPIPGNPRQSDPALRSWPNPRNSSVMPKTAFPDDLGPAACHAEGRGFESLQPLRESPLPVGFFVGGLSRKLRWQTALALASELFAEDGPAQVWAATRVLYNSDIPT